MRVRAAVVLALVVLSAIARADEAVPESVEAQSGLHWGLGAGGFAALTGPAEYGFGIGGEIYPGGRLGRYGLRAELRGWDDGADGLAALGVTFLAAATRPWLQLALHGEAGMTFEEPRPAVGGGVQAHLWIKWPFALAVDGTAVLIVDGSDTALAISSSLQLRVAY